MKERVVYNTYYQYFEEFKHAVFDFFWLLSGASEGSELKEALCRRVRDKFTPIQAPAVSF
jgi:hypothetical protein